MGYDCDDEKCKTCDAKELCKKLEKAREFGRIRNNLKNLVEKDRPNISEDKKDLEAKVSKAGDTISFIMGIMAESLIRSGAPIKDIKIQISKDCDTYSVMVQDFEVGSVTIIHHDSDVTAFGVKADDIIANDLIFRKALKDKGGLDIG
jgi:hypothetical protein